MIEIKDIKNDPERLNMELHHSYYNTGYAQGVADTKERIYKAIERTTALAEPWYMGRVDGKPSNAVLLETVVKVIRDYMEGKE